MRGSDVRTDSLFSYVSCEARVPATHPLRPIRAIVDEVLEVLSPEFEGMYSKVGRPSIPPGSGCALLLQAFYSIRSERQLMEQIGYNLLFRWFVGLSMDAAVWDVTVFTKNRDRRDATQRATSAARSGRTRPTPRPPIPTPSCTARPMVNRRAWPSWAMC